MFRSGCIWLDLVWFDWVLVRFNRGMFRSARFWLDLVVFLIFFESGSIYSYLVVLGWIKSGLVESSWIMLDRLVLVVSSWIWLDLVGSGFVWLDMFASNMVGSTQCFCRSNWIWLDLIGILADYVWLWVCLDFVVSDFIWLALVVSGCASWI